MSFMSDLLENLGGAFGGGLGQAATGGLMDLLGLGGKETKQALPKRPAPQLEDKPMQAPAPPPVPFQPPPMSGGGPPGQQAPQSPNVQAALQRAMARMTGGGR